jgi:hypothetical protein
MAIFGYMQQFVYGPKATPTNVYVHFIDAIGLLVTYMHARYIKNSIWMVYRVKISPLFLTRYGYIQQFVDGPTGTPTHSYMFCIATIGSLMPYMHAQ